MINYSKFKTKNVNGIEICTTPLTVREFRNGDEIKKARTEGEWIKFNELKIPSYHFKDFDENLTITRPDIFAKNFIWGGLFVDLGGQVVCINHNNNEKVNFLNSTKNMSFN